MLSRGSVLSREYFFSSFVCSLLDLRAGDWTARGYVTNSWGYGVILISRDWIRRLVPLFSGDGEIAPNFGKKVYGALIRRLIIAKRHPLNVHV